MALLATVQTGSSVPPPIMLIHGPPGSRKTQFCIDSEAPLLLLTENGLGNRPANHLRLTGLPMLFEVIKELGTTEHAFKTLCIDSLDHLVPLVAKKVCDENAKPNLRAFGYGKGELAEQDAWLEIFRYFEALRDKKGMSIIMTAHSAVKTMDDPSLADAFHRWEPKLPSKVCAVCKEKADVIGCAQPRITLTENENGKPRAIGDGGFTMQISQTAAVEAKNRYRMEGKIDMSFAAWSAAFKKAIA
jgi:hypothetical protein